MDYRITKEIVTPVQLLRISRIQVNTKKFSFGSSLVKKTIVLELFKRINYFTSLIGNASSHRLVAHSKTFQERPILENDFGFLMSIKAATNIISTQNRINKQTFVEIIF